MSDRWNEALEAAAKACEKWADKQRFDITHRTDALVAAAMMCSQAILALREADTGDMVLVPRDRIEGLLEYWNGHPNHSAMLNALNHIQEELHAMLAAAKEERNG